MCDKCDKKTGTSDPQQIMQRGWETIQSKFANDPHAPKNSAEAFRKITNVYAQRSRHDEMRAEANRVAYGMAQRRETGAGQYYAREPVNKGFDENSYRRAVEQKITHVRHAIREGERDITEVAKEIAVIVAFAVGNAAPAEMGAIISIALEEIRKKAKLYGVKYDDKLQKFLCTQFVEAIKQNSDQVIDRIRSTKTQIDNLLET